MLINTNIFEGLSGDAAKWGASDFYEAALRLALESAEPFDTGWYSTKKESQTARISCLEDPEKVSIEVSCGMDNTPDLIDTAIWEAFGGNEYAGSGDEAMRKRYPQATEAQIEEAISDLEARTHGYITLGDDNYAGASKTVEIGSPEEAMEAIKEVIDELVDQAEQELEGRYQSLVKIIQDDMDGIMEQYELSTL